MRDDVVIIGGGLAGSEAAWQAASRGAKVTLYEMRPKEMTQAHKTGGLAELVCSNSLGSVDLLNAPGILKEEMRRLNSLIIRVADQVRVPAGSALAQAFKERDWVCAALGRTSALACGCIVHQYRRHVLLLVLAVGRLQPVSGALGAAGAHDRTGCRDDRAAGIGEVSGGSAADHQRQRAAVPRISKSSCGYAA